MNERQRADLRENRVEIVEDLEPRGAVLDCLIDEEILTDNDVEEIDSAPTRRERCQILLRILPRHGPAAYEAFKKALAQNSLFHIVKKFKHVYNEKEPSVETNIPPCEDCKKFLAKINIKNEAINFRTIGMLRSHVCDVIENVEPRDIFDQLYQDAVLTDNDIEEIIAFNVRRKRCEKLVEILLQKDNDITTSLVNSLRRKYTFIADAIGNDMKEKKGTVELALTKQMSTVASQGQNRKLVVAFNYLSTLVNEGDFSKFEQTTSTLMQRCSQNPDISCIIGYLHACKNLLQVNFDAAKREIRATLELIPKTSNPRYFTLEILTAKSRMYVIQKRLGKLESTQDDAMMLLETDPEGCSGRAVGWLYINRARAMTIQMSCLNLSKQESVCSYEKMFLQAKMSLERSMTSFRKDCGKDGPFGFGFALCRMIILLMRCGDNGKTMDIFEPPLDDMEAAGQYIDHLEKSDIEMSAILRVQFNIAKTDYFFRCSKFKRAREHAQCALKLTFELDIQEYKEYVDNRLDYLERKLFRIQNADENYFAKLILLSDSSDTFDDESQRPT